MMSELINSTIFCENYKWKNDFIIDNVIGDVKRENINNIIIRKEKQYVGWRYKKKQVEKWKLLLK